MYDGEQCPVSSLYSQYFVRFVHVQCAAGRVYQVPEGPTPRTSMNNCVYRTERAARNRRAADYHTYALNRLSQYQHNLF